MRRTKTATPTLWLPGFVLLATLASSSQVTSSTAEIKSPDLNLILQRLEDIQHQDRVIYREAHILLEEIAEAALDGKRKEHMELLATVPLLIIDDLGMRKLGPTAEEELLEIVMRRYERASTLLTSNRPVEDWGKLLGDSAAVTAMLDRLLHHGHILKCGPRSWRTKLDLPDQEKAG